MLTLNMENSLVDLKNIDTDTIEVTRIKGVPDFALFNPDLSIMKNMAEKLNNYQNIIIIGNGGSRTSFHAIYNSLGKFKSGKKIEILTSPDFEVIKYMKNKYSKENTLVVVVSKSGENITPLECMFEFEGYKKLIITSRDRGALLEISKRKENSNDYFFIEHPNIGGRFAGITSCALMPSALIGLNIENIYEGAQSMYEKCHPDKPIDENPALKLAYFLYGNEVKGYREIFCGIYSVALSGFFPLITQLIHESACKNGRGMTFFGDLGPECQHHTTQRFFAGRQNVIGIFVELKNDKNNNEKVKIPEELQDVLLRGGTLKDLDGIPYNKAVEIDLEANYLTAKSHEIPVVKIVLDGLNEFSVGEFMAFWQYVAVYYSELLKANPFDQPGVEASKKKSFELTKKYPKE